MPHIPGPNDLPAIVQWALLLVTGGVGAIVVRRIRAAWASSRHLVDDIGTIAAMAPNVATIAKRFDTEDAADESITVILAEVRGDIRAIRQQQTGTSGGATR